MNNFQKNRTAVILLDSYEGLEYRHKASILAKYENPGDMFDDNRRRIQ